VMVLAIIIGIGSTIFGELSRTLTRPVDIVSAMSLLLAALSLFGLGVFGPGIAAGLVSGAPQLGAGAAAGTVAAAAAVAVGGGALALGGLRMAAGGSIGAVRSAASLAGASASATGSATDAASRSAQLADAHTSGSDGSASSRGKPSGVAHQFRRGQHVRDAARVVGDSLKEGDKGGHSSGPKLGES
jgi:type IV secretion system protein TrbL